MFHIASRWPVVLSNTAPTHQGLFMLIVAHDHNSRHACDHAERAFRAAQRRGPPNELQEAKDAPSGHAAPPTFSTEEDHVCSSRPVKKKEKLVPALGARRCSCSEVQTDASHRAECLSSGSSGRRRTNMLFCGAGCLHRVWLELRWAV